MTIDIAAVRADTPACEQRIHFNNAGASLMPNPVYAAVTEHLALERDIGGYEASRKARDKTNSFYEQFAGLLNCEPGEIAYVENATRAWDMVFYGLKLGKGDRVITHSSEYASNYLAFLQQSQRLGFEIDVAPSDECGRLDIDGMRDMLTPNTKLIAITHVPSQGGLVNPAEAVGELAREHGIWYLLDACQSAGQIDLDVQKIGCHALSGTGRKFLRGPRGTGFLYVSAETLEAFEPAFVDLHSAEWTSPNGYEWQPDAKRYETWEGYVAGKIGLAEAVKYARQVGLPAIQERVTKLAAMLREELEALPGVTVRDLGTQKSGIVTLTKADEDPMDMLERLEASNINVSVTGMPYAMLDLGERDLDAVLRASVHYYNTEAEIGRFIDVLKGQK